MSLINNLETLHAPLTAVKSTNSIYSIISGDNTLLQITDALSVTLDILELLNIAKNKIPIAGIAVSTLALTKRISDIQVELSQDPNYKIETSTALNIVGDLLGIAGSVATIAGPQGLILGEVILGLSVAIGFIANKVAEAEETESKYLQEQLKKLDSDIVNKPIYIESLENFTGFQATMHNFNEVMTGDEIIEIASRTDTHGSEEFYLTCIRADGSNSFELITESKLVSFDDAIKYLNQYSIKNIILSATSKANISLGSENNDKFVLSDYDDVAKASGGDDVILGNGGNDHIYGGEGDDTLIGDDGQDYLYGEEGNDRLVGGGGDDFLVGGNGVDTYEFKAGDGNDTIFNHDNEDIVEINSTVKSIQHGAGSSLYDLIISYGESDSITIKDFYLGDGLSMINKVIDPNRIFNREELIYKGLSISSSRGGFLQGLNGYQNQLTGDAGSYKVTGGNLKDRINLGFSQQGHSILTGNGDDEISLSGGGQNLISGGDGNDSYVLGSGTYYILDAQINGQLNNDKIHVLKNFQTSGITAHKVGNNMLIDIGGNDSITILNWYSSSGYKIEQLTYSNGYATQSISWQELEAMAKEKEESSPDFKLKEMFGQRFHEEFFANLKQLSDEKFVSPVRQRDPLVIDLNGDGVQTVGTNLNVHFDHDGDGNKEQTGWISDSDGFVVLDKNGNGLIDNGTEMFGENTLIDNGDNANDGYQALASYDTNADGKIDANDSIYADLKIWNDRNYNGISEEDELQLLEDLGIKSISVVGTDSGIQDASGNTVIKTGTVEFENGTTGISNSLGFTTNEFSIDENGMIIIDERLEDVSNIGAIGFARSLLESGTINKSLGDLIVQFKDSNSRIERESLVESILVAWAKTASFKDLYERINEYATTVYPPSGTQSSYNQGHVTSTWDKLAIVEVFSGKTLMAVWPQMFYNKFVDAPILEFYDKIHDYVYSSLTDSVRLYDYKQATFTESEANITRLIESFEQNFSIDPRTAIEDIFDFSQLYKADLSKVGFDVNQLILSKIENLEITDTLKAALDSIGYHFVDNTYVNLNGFTSETSIINSSKPKVAVGNDQANKMSVSGDGAIIYGLGGDDIITGVNQGSETIYGGDGNDVIDSGYGPDVIYGGNGDDIIGNSAADKAGSIGNYTPAKNQFFGNTVTGGKGNDTIYGSSYGDIYYFNKGDGQDVITEYFSSSKGAAYQDKLYFGEGIQTSDISISSAGNDLILTIADSGDKITIKGYFDLDTYGRSSELEEIHFSDGTIWDVEFVKSAALTKIGDEGDNLISGNANKLYSDTIYGLGGNDTIYGNAGSDTIYGGDGNDTINGGSEEDRLYGDAGDDTINGGQGIDYIDGGAGNDIINGNEGPDILNGGDGNDIITAGAMDGSPSVNTFYGDTLNGGRGDDKLYGSGYGDKYLFSKGDGNDTIYEASQLASNERTTDRIIFADDILKENVVLSVKGLNLVITFTNSTDKITVINQFADTFNGDRNQKIEEIVFADGTKWGPTDIASKGMITFGTSGDDLIYGNASPTYSDTILGGDGNDTIYGNAGGDFIYGEGGNDTLYGGTESDLIDGGDGDDIINGDLGPDILIGGDGNDTIRAGNTGTAQNSIFYGDTITGGRGNDDLYGSAYGDIYHFNKGDGIDTIRETSRAATSSLYTDKLMFGSDIKVENTILGVQGNDLVISFTDSDDMIKIINQFVDSSSVNRDQKIEEIHFADGAIWDATVTNQTMDNLTQAMSAFSTGVMSDEVQQPYKPNDEILLTTPQ